ncbi:MAG: hypothetical protein U0V87_11375 [Acidobacteriota bacterium]
MNCQSGSARLAAVVAAAVAAAVAVAIVMIDPPKQRLRRLDERRVEDLSDLKSQVQTYFERHSALPNDFAALTHESGFGPMLVDPETSKPYEYEQRDDDSYRLCGTFALDSGATSARHRYGIYAIQWAHPAGRFCFDLEIVEPKGE